MVFVVAGIAYLFTSVVLPYLTRSILAGLFLGALVGGAIVWATFASGGGDMAGLLGMVYGGFGTGIGAGLGGVAGWLGRRGKKSGVAGPTSDPSHRP
jgi:hypothetical protein